ncbi:MAG: hypothetical protein GY757_02005 [bacterium]|nr:hypothetical protein [bacterium]
MNIEELNKLEEKVNNMVNSLKLLKNENEKLQLEIDELKNESSLNAEERTQIKDKVSTLIQLIDSIENL